MFSPNRRIYESESFSPFDPSILQQKKTVLGLKSFSMTLATQLVVNPNSLAWQLRLMLILMGKDPFREDCCEKHFPIIERNFKCDSVCQELPVFSKTHVSSNFLLELSFHDWMDRGMYRHSLSIYV